MSEGSKNLGVCVAAICVSAACGRSPDATRPATVLRVAAASASASPEAAPLLDASSDAPPPAPPDAGTLCERLDSADRAALSMMPSVRDEGGGGGFDATDVLGENRCLVVPGGAWVLRFHDVRPTGGPFDEVGGEWFAAHVDADGRRAEMPGHAFTASRFQSLGLTFWPPNTFDYDGDGSPEVFVKWAISGHSWDGEAGIEVATFRDGRARVYPPTASMRVVGISDEDEDGRMDLVVAGPYVAAPRGASSTHTTQMGFGDLAHSLADGTFSLTDAVAAKAARAGCGALPAHVIVKNQGWIKEWESLQAIHCARLWGRSAADVTAEIRRACRPPTAADLKTLGRQGVCMHYDDMLRWAAATPPLTLR